MSCPTRRYRPDFVLRIDDGRGPDDQLNLVVEIKGCRGEDAKGKKAAMETRWLTGVDALQTIGHEWGGGNLRCQIGISSAHGGRCGTPYAFTEQGVAMLSRVLHSPRAVQVNIAIMRTFVQPRRLMGSSRDLARRIDALDARHDEQLGNRATATLHGRSAVPARGESRSRSSIIWEMK